jgi:SAC3/GANP family
MAAVLLQVGQVQRSSFLPTIDPLFGALVEMAQVGMSLQSAPAQWALRIIRAMRQPNLASFFHLLQQATHVQACLCHLNLLEVRSPTAAPVHMSHVWYVCLGSLTMSVPDVVVLMSSAFIHQPAQHKMTWLQEARRLRLKYLHLQNGAVRHWQPIADLRSMLILDSDSATLEWLELYNPIFGLPKGKGSEAEASEAVASVLIVKELGGLEPNRLNSATQSQFIMDKAKGGVHHI